MSERITREEVRESVSKLILNLRNVYTIMEGSKVDNWIKIAEGYFAQPKQTIQEFRGKAIDQAQNFLDRDCTCDQNMEELIDWMIEYFPREDSDKEIWDEIVKLRGQLGLGVIFGTGSGLWNIKEPNDKGVEKIGRYTPTELRDILRKRAKPKHVTKEQVMEAFREVRNHSMSKDGWGTMERFFDELDMEENDES